MKIVSSLYMLVVPIAAFEMVARQYYPAGYKNGTTSGPPDLYGYGFGALERSYYDPLQQVFYGGSELGYVTVSDYSDYPNVTQADFGLELEDSLTDLRVCGSLLFVTTKDDPNPGSLIIYTAATRNEQGGLVPPTLVQTIEVGAGPDNVIVNKDCSIAATANEGEGEYDDEVGLINPEGSISIIRGPFNNTGAPPIVSTVSLDLWTDDELIEMGVHLPLSLNAMIYWNQMEGINFAAAIDAYTSAAVLEPEYLQWSGDESKIYVNLQENNALVIVDVETNMAESIHAYGLKDWGTVPIDVVKDDDCVLQTVEGLYSLRSADSIARITVDGIDHIVTANEGDDVEYGDFGEKIKSKDLFNGTVLGFANMTSDPTILSPSSITEGTSRFFNAQCNESNPETPFCTDGMSLTLGSAMIDYSNPDAPNVYRMVGIGGRGVTIYKVTDSGLEEVWDSGDDFEREGCAAFPWAHNSIQDEEFAPVGGPFYVSLDPDDGLRETIDELNDPLIDGCEDGGDGTPGACPLGQVMDDRSPKDGPAAETVVVGEACGRNVLVTVSEKSSVGYLYDISDIANPVLKKVFHLSPASESFNPGLAYDARTLGEIDSESIHFLSAEDSPTGNPSVLFSGAFSGTTSLWEFDCGDDTEETDTPEVTESSPSSSATTLDYISGLAALVGLIVIAAMY